MPLDGTIKGHLALLRKNIVQRVLDFQYNPTELSRSGSVSYKFALGPGGFMPVALFGQMGEQNIPLRLFFDCLDSYDPKLKGLTAVLALCESFWLPALDKITAGQNNTANSPDRCLLVMGSRYWYCECVGGSIQEQAFNTKLEPIRAEVTLNLRLINPGAATLNHYVKALDNMRNAYQKVLGSSMLVD